MNQSIRMFAVSGTLLLGVQAGWAEDGGPDNGKVSFTVTNDITSQYFFRGILQEDDGFIWQPGVEVSLPVCEGNGEVQDIALALGIWNSFHDQQTGAPDGTAGPASWYEADLYASLSAQVMEDWNVAITYTAYTSPAGAFETVKEIALSASYDDVAIWEAYVGQWSGFAGLQPTVTVAIEVDEQADNGNGGTAGTDEGTYLEFGLSPTFTVLELGDAPVTLTIPMTLGLSAHDYYESSTGDNSTYGYFRVGSQFSLPLNDSWSAYAGVDFLFLGNSTRDFNDGSDTGFEIIGTTGLAMEF